MSGNAFMTASGRLDEDTFLMRQSGLFGQAMGKGHYYIVDIAFASWQPGLYVTIALSGSDDLNLEAVTGGHVATDAVGETRDWQWNGEDSPTGLMSVHDNGLLLIDPEGSRRRVLADALPAPPPHTTPSAKLRTTPRTTPPSMPSSISRVKPRLLSGGKDSPLVLKLRLEARAEDEDVGGLPLTTLRLAGRGTVRLIDRVTCSAAAFSPPLPAPPPQPRPPMNALDEDAMLWNAANILPSSQLEPPRAKPGDATGAAPTLASDHGHTSHSGGRMGSGHGSGQMGLILAVGVAAIGVVCAAAMAALVVILTRQRRQRRGDGYRRAQQQGSKDEKVPRASAHGTSRRSSRGRHATRDAIKTPSASATTVTAASEEGYDEADEDSDGEIAGAVLTSVLMAVPTVPTAPKEGAVDLVVDVTDGMMMDRPIDRPLPDPTPAPTRTQLFKSGLD